LSPPPGRLRQVASARESMSLPVRSIPGLHRLLARQAPNLRVGEMTTVRTRR
jgi:hypothetical protein